MLVARFERKWRQLEARLNRPMWPRPAPAALVLAWGADSLMAELAQRRPALLVTVTTYRRPTEIAALVVALAAELRHSQVPTFVCVLNDASDADCGAARELLRQHFGDRAAWLDADRNFGKRGFWRTHQMIMHAAQAAEAEYLLSLQDDVELAPDFMRRLWQVWADTGRIDPRRRVLYLFAGDDDEPHGRWHRFERVDLPAAQARRTDWFDLQAFMIDRAGLNLLRHWVVPISPLRWRKDPTLSSGVGRQFTLRLAGRGTVYQCNPPLVLHGKAPSHMNPEARALRPLDNHAHVTAAAGRDPGADQDSSAR